MPIVHGVIGYRQPAVGGTVIVDRLVAVVADSPIIATVQVPGVVATVAPLSIVAEDDS